MPTFAAPDGTALVHHVSGAGAPLVCLPGGPMQDSAYLGGLGSLAAHRTLIRPDLRGTGGSAVPEDPASYRCDRLVGDVEALREHLGLDRMDLLAHSAGANLAALYTTRHPERVSRLALVTPSVVAPAVAVTGEMRLERARLRRDEPWFPEAYAALEAVVAGRATDETWQAIAPFAYGRWDETARAHAAAAERQRNREAAAVHNEAGAFDPDATRAAFAALTAPVLVLAGEFDLNSPAPAMAELAALFPGAECVVQPGAAHFPWLDDPERFTAVVTAFLR
ncbi:alpha/beta hydrolase [Streptomyces sp. DSM 42041]|uniref:Alpha/beta hydrolase n=1 Tax=Streptomyces hazeniae TaxID=3075538 RepID=A0ABU2NUA5_9ACTN|nr:alpha/beta hydrolase [Streptomyces sp. DSM 42041]MDT0380305.1 alpha/beta hydrolase [Streptomyces sp. DSM 42041]